VLLGDIALMPTGGRRREQFRNNSRRGDLHDWMLAAEMLFHGSFREAAFQQINPNGTPFAPWTRRSLTMSSL
jgi:hypothetical protein